MIHVRVIKGTNDYRCTLIEKAYQNVDITRDSIPVLERNADTW